MLSNILPRGDLLLFLLQAFTALADDDLAVIGEAVVLPQGFSPRFFDGSLPIQPLGRRQDTGTCANGSHRCEEIGTAGANKCCGVNQYCYYKPDWEVGCCGLGTTCDPQCTGTSYRTNATLTVTSTSSLSATGSDATTTGIGTLDETVITTTVPGCVARACAVSAYRCPLSMGGGCCDNSQVCASNTQCLESLSTTPTLVPTRGCSGTPSATDCPSDGGCCLRGQTCVSIGSTLGCTGTADPPAGTNGTVTTNTGLSQSAKAGIGAGVAIGAAIVIGALTWFCIRRRRDERERTAGERTRTVTPGPDSTLGGGHAGGGMSEISGPSGRQRVHRNGTAYEYLGPNAVSGPYTQRDDDNTHSHTTPDLRDRGGVLVSGPQDPSDIRHPVEMDSSSTKPAAVARGASTKSAATRRSEAVPPPGGEEGVLYELEGSLFPEPSPMSPDDLPSAQSQTPGSSQFFTPASPGLISPPGGTMRSDYMGEIWNEKK
ncbi:hypothetical protein BKA67DRAFT_302679 [Truncatella angustata]|uniref:Uncharacterized protein n=1 Tax=Truncatella angustata TaxID=152316 RepID=A0A9P8ZWA9_9PEZI|nr:uncharacterized protein BKA67DRAFT_302679 [Truncatella angustata]KAH6652861.1 hypothetical protein BKA67DRAFT_302679 [Truncatella angustata]